MEVRDKMVKPDYVLFDKDTTAIIFGNQEAAVQRMLDFDYLSGKVEVAKDVRRCSSAGTRY
jgi:hypothetical protein